MPCRYSKVEPGDIRVMSFNLWYSGGKAGQNKKVTKLSQFLGGEDEVSSFSNRVENVKNLLDNKRFQRWIYESDKVPLFICGDFNTPTHLDWVESTKDTHGGWVYEWPATKLLQDSTGLADAYRVKYPDPKKNPGYTWSTVQKFEWDWNNTIPEPQDRIDFIYFKKELFDVKHAFTYCGNTTLQPIPNEYKNDYPSDHYAVVGDFNYKKT
ncbi:Endonuclease/exonuclease/phosphatase family protein [Aphelenchoides bicaudatus]|nr:Endonuclease/exonuclease/phosphatase family protein [Aphelenchoides bicaudatus]